MDFQNQTVLRAEPARTNLAEELGVLSVVVETHYRVDGESLRPMPDDEHVRRPTDPPRQIRHAIWFDASITAAGTVRPTDQSPHVRPVSLSVGTRTWRLVVFGDRVWERSGGVAVPSEPLALNDVLVSFERAFGGGYDVPAGVVPGTDMPHPGGRVIAVENPAGRGLYENDRSALGKPLPNVERPDALIRRPTDRPRPAAFAPCPDLHALRSIGLTRERWTQAHSQGASDADILVEEARPMRMLHHATEELIVPRISVGERVELVGMGKASPLRFEVPAVPTRVEVALGRSEGDAPGKVRSMHIDADAMTISIVHAHTFTWPGLRLPTRVRVLATR